MTRSNKNIWGKPTKDHIKRMEIDTPLISINPDDIIISPPPGKAETKIELQKVMRSVNAADNFNFISISDKSPMDLFRWLVESKGLKFHEEYFKDLKAQLKKVILHLKFRFNRQRPSQVLGRDLGNDMKASILAKSKTTHTPSYPSGHTIQSHVIANQLSKIYPQYSSDFKKLAEMISLARMQGGSHFPSDIIAGEEVATLIDRNIAEPYSYYGLSLEGSMRSLTREFLSESVELGVPEKLRVLDFDDTIAFTTERVRVETPTGPKMISSEEFAIYELAPGEYFDPDVAFDEFQSVDAEKATPVPFISDLFKTFVDAAGSREILILTARSQSVKPHVMNFLEKRLGIQNPDQKVKFVGVADKDPMAKVREIQAHLDENPSVKFVSFYDDSGKNVRAVSNFLEDRGIDGDVRQVVTDPETGDTRLMNIGKEISEVIDYRAITRSFLFRSL